MIVGRVVSGTEVLTAISKLQINEPRYDNPYFAAGLAMGDKRAITTERGFYRPFKKVVIVEGGEL